MSSKEERQELIAEPLPVTLSDLAGIIPVDYTLVSSDRVLTSVVQIEEQIDLVQSILQPYLNSLQAQKNTLMDRARKEGIKEDAGAVMAEIWGKQFRNEIDDLDKFRQTFKDEYEVIRQVQEKDIEEKYKKQMRDLEESKIPLTLADKYVGKEAVTEYVGYKPQTITYEVKKK